MAPDPEISELTKATTNMTLNNHTKNMTTIDAIRAKELLPGDSKATTTTTTTAENHTKKEHNFTFHSSLAHWNISTSGYFASHPETHVLAAGITVVAPSSTGTPHLLLVQRSSTDSYPNLWEAPGGSVDNNGETILEGAARELKEETGLTVKEFMGELGMARFKTGGRSEKWWNKPTFVVGVWEGDTTTLIGEKIVLDEKEHQDWLWATEDDVVQQLTLSGDVEMEFISPKQKEVMLQAFSFHKSHTAPINLPAPAPVSE